MNQIIRDKKQEDRCKSDTKSEKSSSYENEGMWL